MIRPAPPPPDAAFEDDVRAMLARRAGDLAPPVPDPAALQTEPRPSSPAARRGRRGWAWAAAAAVVLVAGAAGAVALRPGDRDRAEVAPAADRPLPPPPADAVWPLSSDVPRERVAGPVRAARAFLTDVGHLQGPADVTAVDRPGEHRATVYYRGPGVPGAVRLQEVDGAWFVTGATSDGVALGGVQRVAPGTVRVDLAQRPGAASLLVIASAQLVDRTGRVVDAIVAPGAPGTVSSTILYSVGVGPGGQGGGALTPLRPVGPLPCTCVLRAPAGAEPAAVVVVGTGADLRAPRPTAVSSVAAAPVPEEVSPP
jgi:hypothetical protein